MNDLVDRIAAGEATLLGIDEICTRLGISRTTFDRWVRCAGSQENITFPAPDIRIGNSPKWEMETFKRWLAANANPGGH